MRPEKNGYFKISQNAHWSTGVPPSLLGSNWFPSFERLGFHKDDSYIKEQVCFHGSRYRVNSLLVLILIFFFSYQVKIGLWIDLTNTSRFYDKDDIEKEEARYVKLQCRGHSECPTVEQVTTFVNICDNFIRKHPLEVIGKFISFFKF